jgi:WD40 repeat protein
MPQPLGRVVVLACLAFALPALGGQPTGVEAERPRTERRVRADHHGDPLPHGALARLGATRFRHAVPVLAASFSSDGKSLLSASADGAVIRWDLDPNAVHAREWLPANSERAAVTDGLGLVMPVARTADGRSLMAAGERYAVCVRDLATGKLLWRVATDCPPETCLAISPDARVLACRGPGFSLTLRDVATGKTIRRLLPAGSYPSHASFSPDGKTVAVGGLNGLLGVWEAATGKEVRRMEGHELTVDFAVFTPDGKGLVSSGWDGTVRLWDLATGREARRFRAGAGRPYCLAVSPDGKTLAAGEPGRRLRLWRLPSGKEVPTLGTRQEEVLAVTFAPDSKTVAFTEGWTVRLWDLAAARERWPLVGHLGGVRAIAFSPHGKQVATAGADHAVLLWEAATGRQLGRLRGATPGGGLAFTPGGKTLTVQTSQGLRCWDVLSGQPLPARGKAGPLPAGALSPTGDLLAVVAGKSLSVHEAETGRERFRVNGDWVGALAYSGDGRALASLERTGAVRLWDLAAGKERGRFLLPGLALNDRHFEFLPELSDAGPCLALSPDGRRLAASDGESGWVSVWEVATGTECCRWDLPKGAAVGSLSFSPDGRLLAVGDCTSGDLSLWRAATGRRCGLFPGRPHCLPVFAFSPSGRSVALAAPDRAVLIWQLDRPASARAARGNSPQRSRPVWDLAAAIRRAEKSR